MAVIIVPTTVAACQPFIVSVTGAPGTATQAVFTYDGAPTQTLPVVAGVAGPATFTAVGSGAQTVSVVYLDAMSAVVGAENGTVTVTPAPAGTLTTTLTTPLGGLTTATTLITCSGGLLSINGTLTYTLPGGVTVTATVINGVVVPTSLGVALTAGQTVGVSFTAAAGSCPACTPAPITVVVPPVLTCSVVVQPVVGPVIVGQPTSVTAVVLCNGLPVAGASVTFTGGAAPVTVTTNAAGIAIGSLTFNTAGTATVTATVTAPAGTECECTGVVSLPVTITVGAQTSCLVAIQPVVGPVVVGQPTSVSAVVTCNGLPVSGASVTFTGGAVPVTVTTNVVGIATGSLTFNTAGTATVTATVTAPAGTECECTGVVSLPVTITVGAQTSCLVAIQPVVGPVVVGRPTSVTAVVTCNGLPVAGASVTFTGGAAPVTVTTNAAGIATGSLTFNTAGPATVTATVTAPAGTACACKGVVSAPVIITVSGQTGPTLQASPACWRINLPFPVPSLFTATLKATLTPAQAGVTVTFFVSGLPVGTAVTNASGVATLNAGLSLLQISAGSYTATATVGGATIQATGTLAPCFPPV
ncbi:Ig-like domain-containing protein [Streptomyces decoyicus]|uniref:hypothetical protein n=1 Tax=Streptomyces decoyicus TaxID=249567 RepID=UPI002E3748C0|nr:hypothetical protein [Streptomyces decoyicus]